jgi:hypothetical protein
MRRGGRILTRPGAGLSRVGAAGVHERGAETARVRDFDTSRLAGAGCGGKHGDGYQRRKQQSARGKHREAPSTRPSQWLGEPPGLFLHHHCALKSMDDGPIGPAMPPSPGLLATLELVATPASRLPRAQAPVEPDGSSGFGWKPSAAELMQ